MIKKLMQRSVVSDRSVATFDSTAASLVAAAVLLLGFNRFEHFEFTEAQLYLATIGTLMLAAAFVGLALLFRPPFRRLTGEARAGHAQQNAPN